MTQLLFDKPLNELREAFVRTRFAEPTMFGRPDIEQWLRGPEVVGHPNFAGGGWMAHRFQNELVYEIDHKIDAHLLAVVRANATPDVCGLGAGFSEPHRTVVAALRASGVVTYRIVTRAGGDTVLVFMGEKLYVTESGRDSDTHFELKTAKGSDVFRLLLSEARTQGPLGEQALAWLRMVYERAIAKVRKAAERDFDEAVAVSEDGTKIVKADEVAVILDEDRLLIFPASAFVDNKILLSPDMTRYRDMVRYPKVDYATWVLRSMTMWNLRRSGQVLDTSFARKGETCFITEQRFCPSPLPDGGREIRVS